MGVSSKLWILATLPLLVGGEVRLRAAEILIEAESFEHRGGWLLDPQFVDQMGSPYLLAHGLGKGVANARTDVRFPECGRYRLFVRTKDWVPSHHPGRFRVVFGGKTLETEFGASGEDWSWQAGGSVDVTETRVSIELEDLTGFDGRCDALYFTTDPDFTPPTGAGERAAAWRLRLLGLPGEPPSAGTFDVVVVGGGIPGCSAALAAARLGCSVALIQNRPVLGGNASAEIGITPRDQISPLVMEIAGPGPDGSIRAESVLRAEKSVHLFLDWHAFGASKTGDRIVTVDAKHTSSSEELRFHAPVFIDCTGRAALGSLAGAECRLGREGKAEFNESLAPDEPDGLHHGNTVIFRTRMATEPVPFPEVPWATAVSKDHADLGGQVAGPRQDNLNGPRLRPVEGHEQRMWRRLTHFWEYGQRLDPYADAEHIRDHLLCAIYGTFATVKSGAPEQYARLELAYVGHVPATGEFRRLVGDYILTERDIRQQRVFPDAVALNCGHFCLHYPGDEYDFRLGDWKWVPVKPFVVPFRCLYSRNIVNLMMAGKHISVSHIAGAATKTMLNGGQHGVAAGVAAYLCRKHRTVPRVIGEQHLEELQRIIAQSEELRSRR